MTKPDELWMCPERGRRFVTSNMWRPCSNYPLEHHFDGASSVVRAIFDQFAELIESHGLIEGIPQKKGIAIQAKVRFAGCVARKKWLLANLRLTRRVSRPKLRRTGEFGAQSYGPQFRLDTPDDIDDAFGVLVREAYGVGMREHSKR